jgi:putative DNA methylase
MTVKTHKKLIEVALPLEAINRAAREEKAVPRPGHPQTMHYWWARRPLAVARAVIFAQMVDDPSVYVDTLRADPRLKRKAETALKDRLQVWEEARALADKAKGTNLSVPEPGPAPTLDEMLADAERQRLFRIIDELVKWENTTNQAVLQRARDEIWQSWRRACAQNIDNPRAKELFDRRKLPSFHDPFAGGGALPLEAQRLGLEAYASDLNPVAVLINKAMIEIPPRFARRPPVNPESRSRKELLGTQWEGAEGLANDVRYYGQWMRDEAEKRIGHLYPKVTITAEMANERPDLMPLVGRDVTVIAWLWARTVKSPNPAFADVDVPLASTFMLSIKPGKEAYVEPVIDGSSYRFTVKVGNPKDLVAAKNGTKLSRANFGCLMSGSPVSGDYIKSEGKRGRLGARMLAMVAEGARGRVYLAPTPEHENAAREAKPDWRPEGEIAARMTGGNCTPYGLTTWGDLFTDRQLVAMTIFSDLGGEAREQVRRDALAASFPDDGHPLREKGLGATAYADSIGVYLACALSRLASYNNSICHWNMLGGSVAQVFARQAIPMSWDFIEVNPLQKMSGNWMGGIEWVADVFQNLEASLHPGFGSQADARSQEISVNKLVSTDPPYYDNIGYADLSDFFYVWLRRSVHSVFPELFETLAVPKAGELVATAHRHGGREAAEKFFLKGMTEAIQRLSQQAHPAFPVTIYYAFKQSTTDSDTGTASTGWDTFLDAVIRAGFAIGGTWPVRTEKQGRMVEFGTNALASSIVLVCRRQDPDAKTVTRREFAVALKAELPAALRHLQAGNIAPVDLAQAAIGPGMGVYTRYDKVLDAEGKPVSVREALALINQTLDEALAEQEGEFDPDSRWALAWFEQSGFAEGEYGVAETLSKAKNISVAGLAEGRGRILESRRGKVRLLRPEELPADWDPATDPRLSAWEVVHQLIRALANGGEVPAAGLVAKLGAKAEVARELAYRLYTLCERKKRAAEALAYNGLVQSWPEIVRLAQEGKTRQPTQGALFEATET